MRAWQDRRGGDLRRIVVAAAALVAVVGGPGSAGAEGPSRAAAAPPLPAAPRPVTPNRDFFARDVEPVLKEACAACHRGGRGGALDLAFGYVPGGDGRRVALNFEATLRTVDATDPARSTLLRKGLSIGAGGLPHAGGEYMTPGSPADRAIRDFLAGATPTDRPPVPSVAPLAPARTGDEVRLDGSGTVDPEGRGVAFEWTLAGRPAGSVTLLGGARTATPSFTADAPGLYVLRMRAWDGSLEALPVEVRVTVADGAAASDAPAGGAMSMDGGAAGDTMAGGLSGDMAGGASADGAGSMMDGSRATETFLVPEMDAPGPGTPVGGGRPLDDGPGPPLDAPLAERRHARSVFHALRGRGPTPGELARAMADRPEALVDRMLAERETWEAWLDAELYYYLLIDRFRPVSDRVLALPGLLAAGRATFVDATREIVVSAEFNQRNPGNDTFVTVVLEQLLGMVVQDQPRVLAEGKRMYDGYRTRLFNEPGDNQSDIVRIVLGHRDFLGTFLRRQYRRVFGGPLPRAEEDAATARLAADPAAFRALLREWLLSDAFRAVSLRPRVKDDQVFIRTLFADILRREPTFDEFRNMRNAFLAMSDPAPVRNVLAQLLVESPMAPKPSADELARPRDWVRGRFLDLLGRAATEAELDVFVSTLGEYGCDPRTITLALVTSPHYQYY